MAAVVANFEGGGSGIQGNVNQVTGTAAGVLIANCTDYDTGSPTGISFSCDHSRTADATGGKELGEDQLVIDVSENGHWYQGVFEYYFGCPANFVNADLDIFLITDFAGQGTLEVSVNGVVQVASWDSTGNTDGSYITVTGVTADAQDEIVVSINNASGSGYVFANGARLRNIVYAAVTQTIGQVTESDSAQPVVDGSQVIGTIGQVSETNSAFSVFDLSPIAAAIGLVIESDTASSVSVPGQFSDYFNGDGSLSGWTAYNDSALPNVQRVGGQYQSGTISAVGSTTWFDLDRGRMDGKLQSAPASGFKEYVFENVGVGPATDPTQNLAYGGSGHFAFCGIIVHDESMAAANYEFLVVGHRGGNASSTLEIKRTVNGNSDPINDEGANAVGVGVTKADIRLRFHSTGAIDWAYRAVGDTAWTVAQEGTGWDGSPGAGSMSWSSSNRHIGLITYAYNAVPTPFVGHVDSAVLISELPPVSQTVGQVLESDSLLSVIDASPIAHSIGQVTEVNSALQVSDGSSIIEAIGQVVEGDSPFSVVDASPVAEFIGQVTESSTVFPVTSFTAVIESVNQVIETNAIFPITDGTPIVQAIGLAVESNQAIGLQGAQNVFDFYPWGGITEFGSDGVIPVYRKDPQSLTNYWFSIQDILGELTIDGVPELIGGAELTSDPVQVNSAELTVGTKTYKANSVMGVQLSGGTLRQRYRLTFRFTLNSGETDDRSVDIEILDK